MYSSYMNANLTPALLHCQGAPDKTCVRIGKQKLHEKSYPRKKRLSNTQDMPEMLESLSRYKRDKKTSV